MPKPLSSRTLLALTLVAPMLGCVAKPPEKPIVLRPPHPERRLARRPPHQTPSQTADTVEAAPANAVATPAGEPEEALSPAEKEALFREFDQYLTRSGRPQ